MELNYFAAALISFLPLLLAWIWFRTGSGILAWSGEPQVKRPSILQFVGLYILSFGFIYGMMNLVIHQIGFYELFFTDIMKGSQEAKKITEDFLAIYGHKHRHFGHGLLHGSLNALAFALPFVSLNTLTSSKGKKYFWLHFSY